ncbi:MAG: iron complex outerrane recepter protein [Verrucomicrobiota bacterium]
MIRSGLAKFGFFGTALALSAGLPLIPAFSVSAQEPSPKPTSEVVAYNENGTVIDRAEVSTERVIVTGSNIPTAQEVGPNPVLNINRDLINKSGERTVEELLRNLPVANANGVPVSNNENGSNTAVGAATISLRGFDARATLILLDGRRVAPYPTSNAGIVFIDLLSIPQASIESIEILKDGASTTYGADAVAGVVNIKRRHNYNGAEASVEYGNTLNDDTGQFSSSIIFGVGNSNTNITGVINYYHRNSIANRDRSYSAVPPFLSSNASPYNLEVTRAAVVEAGGPAIADPTTIAHAPFLTNGLAPASAYTYTPNYANRFNFNQFSLSFPESERYGGYVSFDHKFFGDQVVLYGDMMYQNVKTHNELAPPATGNFQTAGQITVAIPPRVANLAGTTPFGGPTYAETGVTPGAFNPFNPFNQILSGGTRARLAEFGNRLFDNETDAYLGTLGVRGDKLFDGTWGYDAAFRYSQIKNTTTGTQVSISRFNRIVNQADPIFRPGSSEYIGTTVAFNPFGDYRVPIPGNQATVDFARIHPTDLDTSKLATVDANIYTIALVDLPAGGVGFALGGQFRREELDESPDQLNVIGDVAGNSAIAPAHGGRKSYALYTETTIPIFSEKNAIPGVHALDVTAAARFEEFLNNNTNVLVPKVGLRWQPLDESLTLRATAGEGFREPSLEELFSSPMSSIQASHDPLRIDPATRAPTFESETPVLTTSNPNLQPEDSRTFSAGAVYSPKYVPGLTLSLDLWDIERTGVVQAPTPDQVLAREAMGALLPGERVERLPSPGPGQVGAISRIVLANQNAASQTARGIDFGIQYQWPTSIGTFTSLTQATYLDAFFSKQTELGRTDNLRGRTTNEGASDEGYYKWKADTRLDWAWKGFDVIGTVRYIDGFHEHGPQDDPVPHYVKQTFTLDLQASYDFTYAEESQAATTSKDSKAPSTVATVSSLATWQRLLNGLRLTVGCNNVLDRDPPHAFGEGGNGVGYPGFTYDATGRFVYVRVTKKF